MMNKNMALVIMAAGMGSRFGGGIKQLTPIGPNGELIIDYSIYDAIAAGFNKIVFIIRRDIEADFMEIIGHRIEKLCASKNVSVHYAYQDLKDLPTPFVCPESRKKPWGTGHAVLAAKHLINEPFVVINADDYYGKVAFKELHDFIANSNESCMAGFILKNTLSENGGVTRGVCQGNNDNYLTAIKETYNIQKSGDVAVADDNEVISLESFVSMNMWGLHPEFLETLDSEFIAFLNESVNSEKDEYLLPKIVGKLLAEDKMNVKILPTPDKWVGVTYQEDKQLVMDTIRGFLENGVYPRKLFD